MGTNPDVITSEAAKLLSDTDAYDAMARAINPFGDGQASDRIVHAVKDYFGC